MPRRRFAAVWARSLLGRYVPGNVVMVASRLVLGQEAGISRKVSLAASVYEQALSLGAASAGGLLLLAAYGAGEIGAGGVARGARPARPRRAAPEPVRPPHRLALRRAKREPLEALLTGRQVLALLAWYLLGAVLLALGIGLLVHSAVGDDGGSLLYVGLSFLTSFVVSMLAFIFPSGLGLREGAFALALGRNLPGGVAIAMSAGTRLALTLAELVFVGAAVLLDQAGRRADGDQAEVARPAAHEQRVELERRAHERGDALHRAGGRADVAAVALQPPLEHPAVDLPVVEARAAGTRSRSRRRRRSPRW